MKEITGRARYNRIMRFALTALLIAAVCVCFAGCRERITNRDDADRVAKDENGAKNEEYEQRRKDLGMELTADEPINRKEDKKKEEQKIKEKKTDPRETNRNTNSDTVKTRTGQNNSSGKDAGKKGNGNKGKGSSKGNGPDSKKKKRKEEPQKKVIVHFDANGGTCEPDSIEYIKGSSYSNMPVPARKEYVFKGWYSAKEGGQIITSDTQLISESEHTLYAHWEKGDSKAYILTFDPCGGRIKNREKTREISYGSTYGTMPLPVKDGCDFLGWFTDTQGGEKVSESSTFKGKADQTLYAQWKYDPYKYWSTKRQRIFESMYACQVVDCYIEFEDHKTATTCSLLSDVKIGNCARNRGDDTTVTDDWVNERNPNAIIKCKGSSAESELLKAAVKERFPDRRVIIVPGAAVNGSDNERLYYSLCLGKAIYPSWFEEVDIDKAGSELGASGKIYE